MPELPDVVVYVEALERRVIGQPLLHVRLCNPFVLRTALPPIGDAEGKRIRGIRRLGKRIVLATRGRALSRSPSDDRGTIALARDGDEAAKAHHARAPRIPVGHARVHRGRHQAPRVAAPRSGRSSARGNRSRRTRRRRGRPRCVRGPLRQENHTLKRALTDPHLFSGIGNAYSDEILHRARLSPLAIDAEAHRRRARTAASTRRAIRAVRMDRAAARRAPGAFPRRSRPSGPRWRCTDVSAAVSRLRQRRCSASSTPRTSATIARAARPTAGSSPIGRCRDY